MTTLAATMTAAGVSQENISRELLLFTAAVQEDLIRLYCDTERGMDLIRD